jgi:isopentenyl-diphosphate delta-isomerase
VRCKEFIVSGGIKNYLDGFYHIQKMPHTAIYGQASALLTSAQESYEALEAYLQAQIKGLQLAYTYLRPR